MRKSLHLIGAVFALWCAGTAAHAQKAPPKIWDMKLGIPVSALPLNDYVDPACGTNGGPPARVLRSFADFAQCANRLDCLQLHTTPRNRRRKQRDDPHT